MKLRHYFAILLFHTIQALQAQGPCAKAQKLFAEAKHQYQMHNYQNAAAIYSKALHSKGCVPPDAEVMNAACAYALSKQAESLSKENLELTIYAIFGLRFVLFHLSPSQNP